MKTQTKQVVVVLLLAIILGAFSIKYAAYNDARLTVTANCVVTEAKKNGYTGNPYTREAWNTFIGQCM